MAGGVEQQIKQLQLALSAGFILLGVGASAFFTSDSSIGEHDSFVNLAGFEPVIVVTIMGFALLAVAFSSVLVVVLECRSWLAVVGTGALAIVGSFLVTQLVFMIGLSLTGSS